MIGRAQGGLPDGTPVYPAALTAPIFFSPLTRPDRDVWWLAEAVGDAVAELPVLVLMAGTIPTGGAADGGSVSASEVRLTPQTFRWSSDSFMTAATDTPSLTYIEGRLAPTRIESTIGTRPDGSWANRATRQVGMVTLLDPEGDLLSLQDEYVFEGRRIAIKVATGTPLSDGTLKPPRLADFSTVFVGQIDRVGANRGRIEIRIRDAASQLDRPVAQDSYLGTGGQAGGEELAGVSKPEALGRCRNVPAVLIDAEKQIYQLHRRRMREVQAVYERGLVQSPGPAVATYEELTGLTVEGDELGDTGPQLLLGQYATCLATGHIRLGAIPLGIVTADIRGDGDTAARRWSNGRAFKGGRLWRGSLSTQYIGTAAGIILRLLQDYAKVPEAEIAVAQIDEVDNRTNTEAGYFVAAGDRNTKVRDIIEQFASVIGCFLDRDSSGQYILTALRAPENFQPVLEIDESMVKRSDGGTTLERIELSYGRPWPSVRLSYARNWRPLSEQEVAEGATREVRAFAQRQSEVAEVVAPLVNLLHGERPALEIEGVGLGAVGARFQALELTKLYRLGRQQYRATVKGVAFRLRLGDTVALRHSKHGLTPRRWIVFSGTGDEVIILRPGAAFLPTAATPFTIAQWLKPAALPAGRSFTIRSSATGTSIFTAISSLGYLQYFTNAVTTTIGEPVEINSWVHFVLTYDGTVFRHYVNGAQTGGPVTLIPAAGSATVPATLGAFNEAADNSFAGAIDDHRFYNRAITLDEIRRLYTWGSLGKHRERTTIITMPNIPGLKMRLDLSQVLGDRRFIEDLSGNGMVGFLGSEWGEVEFGEEQARRLAVMGIAEDARDNATTLLLWG